MISNPIPFSREELLSIFNYDPLTGAFTHARDINKVKVKIGDKAGSLTNEGYLRTKLRGVEYRVHNLIWKMQTGEDPAILGFEIDHKDRTRDNNIWTNLRLSTSKTNNLNKTPVKSTSGMLPGVRRNKTSKANPYQARILVNGVRVSLGFYPTQEMANSIYEEERKIVEAEERGEVPPLRLLKRQQVKPASVKTPEQLLFLKSIRLIK